MAPCATSADQTIATFVYQDRVYASPTRATFPSGLPDDKPESDPHYAPWHRCCWAKKDFPELAFYPTARRLKGALFEVFPPFKALKKVQLDHMEAANGRELHRMMDAEKINALELTLVKARHILIYHTGSLVSVDYKSIRSASSERYMEWKDDRERAQKAAFFARRRLLYEVAHISWAIACLTVKHGDTQAWCRILIQQGTHPSDVEAMQASSLANFGDDNPRAGVFVRPDCDWFLKLPVLVAARIPVFIDWGPISAPFALPAPAAINRLHWLRPSDQQVREANRVGIVLPKSQHVPDSCVLHRPPSPIVDPACVAPSSSLAGPWAPSSASSAWGSALPERWGVSSSGPAASTSSTALKSIPVPPKWIDGMTVGTFFRKRDAWSIRWKEQHENARQKQARLQREANARKFQVPTKGELYVWVQSPSKAWKREHVEKVYRDTYWGMFSNKCKRYDGAANEWDIAPFFERTARSSGGTGAALDKIHNCDSSEDEDYDAADAADPSFRGKDFDTPPASPRGLVIIREDVDDDPADLDDEDNAMQAVQSEPPYLDLEAERGRESDDHARGGDAALHGYDGTVAADPRAEEIKDIGESPTLASVISPLAPSHTVSDHLLITHNLDFVTVLQNMYGWRRGREELLPPGDSKQKVSDVATAFKVFGFVEGGSGASLSSPAHAQELMQWASLMAHKAAQPPGQHQRFQPLQNPDEGPPAGWWRFHKSADARREILQTLSRCPLQVRPLSGIVERSGSCNESTRGLYAITLRVQSEDDPGWCIIAEDPRTALYVALTADSLREAAWTMASSGMALHTVARCDAEVPTEGYRTRPLRGVLWRPANYRFTAFDFACYEAARRYFIQEPGIARAAFLMGGIIWRLAYNAQYPHVVLFGPDIERLALTKEYRVEISGKTYVDNLLNGDELALIGGEYRQKILHRDQTCGLSWWPSYSVWRRSALDVAFWSPIAENWYQGMVSRYRAGDAKPRNSKDWARYLVGWDKRALNTSRRVVQAAEEIIELSGAR